MKVFVLKFKRKRRKRRGEFSRQMFTSGSFWSIQTTRNLDERVRVMLKSIPIWSTATLRKFEASRRGLKM